MNKWSIGVHWLHFLGYAIKTTSTYTQKSTMTGSGCQITPCPSSSQAHHRDSYQPISGASPQGQRSTEVKQKSGETKLQAQKRKQSIQAPPSAVTEDLTDPFQVWNPSQWVKGSQGCSTFWTHGSYCLRICDMLWNAGEKLFGNAQDLF